MSDLIMMYYISIYRGSKGEVNKIHVSADMLREDERRS